jgi:hypothetical protein
MPNRIVSVLAARGRGAPVIISLQLISSLIIRMERHKLRHLGHAWFPRHLCDILLLCTFLVNLIACVDREKIWNCQAGITGNHIVFDLKGPLLVFGFKRIRRARQSSAGKAAVFARWTGWAGMGATLST